MKKIIIVIVLLGLAVFGGKLYLESKYESELNKAIAMAGAFADISYDDVKIGWDSSISVNGLRITPRELGDTIDIRTVKFNSSDPFMPIKGHKTFEKGEFPEQLSVDVKGLNVDASLVNFAEDKEECRSLQSTISYTAVGLDRINADFKYELDFRDPANSTANIRMLDQLTTSTIDVDMNANQLAGVAVSGDLPFTKFELTTELDEELAKELVAYCAEVFKVPPETYLSKVVASPKFAQNTFGADLGSDVNKALVSFLQGGKRLSFRLRPSSNVTNMKSLANLRPNQVLDRLNVSIALDGLRVPVLVALETVEEKQERIDEENGVTKDSVKQRQYVKVNLSNAKQYIGQRIRIKRKGDKKPIKGRMSGFKDDRVAIEVYRHGGEMTLNVGVKEISQFEIYR